MEEIMKRLKYTKLNNANNVLSIDLGNGYSVIAIHGYSKILNQFEVTLFIKDNQFATWRMIGNAEKLSFGGTFKTINAIILKEIEALHEDKFFNYYIEQYQFEESCLSDVIEKVERERQFNV